MSPAHPVDLGAQLAAHDVAGTDETTCIDLIAELERLTSAAAALQARLAVRLDVTARSREAAAGVPAAQRGRGVAGQLALARRESPHRGRIFLGLAHDLTTDLPHTLDALASGHLSEYRALVIARETGCLDRADRARVDAEVCADLDRLAGLGTRSLLGLIRRRVAITDPAAVTRRARKAVTERRVSLRPAPDTMAYLTALLPVAEAVAAHAALSRDASAITTVLGPDGEDRSRGRTRAQVAADLLVERLTGQATAAAVPVTVDLVLSDATLLGAGHEPATLIGGGPLPAQIARELVAASIDGSAPGADPPTWLRRIYADPTGTVTATSSKQRFAPEGLAAHLRVRDQGLCRTPYCDAPARHVDHVISAADGGPTTTENTQGLCEACNHTKQALGWQQQTVAGTTGRHTVRTTTPTGHQVESTAPAPPQPITPRHHRLDHSVVESFLQIRLAYAA